LTAVAPTVRFNVFEILVTPTFFFASDFNSRTSVGVQGRLTNFFLGILVPSLGTGLVSHKKELATRQHAA
jgi:hypothetical protein